MILWVNDNLGVLFLDGGGSATPVPPVIAPEPVPPASDHGRLTETYLYPLRAVDGMLIMDSDTVRLVFRRTDEAAEVMAILQEN